MRTVVNTNLVDWWFVGFWWFWECAQSHFVCGQANPAKLKKTQDATPQFPETHSFSLVNSCIQGAPRYPFLSWTHEHHLFKIMKTYIYILWNQAYNARSLQVERGFRQVSRRLSVKVHWREWERETSLGDTSIFRKQPRCKNWQRHKDDVLQMGLCPSLA